MTRVLIDGRITGHDGIGRYTHCLTTALAARTDGTRIEVLAPAGTRRYSRTEDDELLDAARTCRADVIHLLDYRVPLLDAGIPMVVTVHDILRLLHPEHCYSDAGFAVRFGSGGLGELRSLTVALREMADPPKGSIRTPVSLHEEFYARMLAFACARAAFIITPTRTVAHQLSAALGREADIRVSPWGIDHPVRTGQPATGGPMPLGRYLLYVGQARTHKGLPALLAAFRASSAPDMGVRLVCVGRDFASGEHGAKMLADELGGQGIAVGAVSDAELTNLYGGAEALIHLAEHEGFGFPPLEALATGTRVVANDIPVLRETLSEHAIFVHAANRADVVSAIDRVLASSDHPDRRTARMSWARNYRWDKHAAEVSALYVGMSY